ncbi:unnamed protein product [Adineta steineri]|uniref:RRM domain-containing protein n=1 Tax=Adineta steineri TaxID=433720 RepID=A0A813PTC3_9BILA|nr:unnamed protein product [Adineta steineri]CAF3686752.1 unnamed protein product [Adineta steineri]
MSEERDESDDRSNSKSSRHHDYLVKLSGIPYSTTKDDIKRFLQPCHITTIHLFEDNDNPSNECFVELESEVDVTDALKKSGVYLDKKYVEVFRTTDYEFNFHVKHKGQVTWSEPVIRMSGLPFSCTMGEVQNFFENIEIARNGIYITRDMADQALGDGFVAFVNMTNAYKAIDTHDQKRIQHRFDWIWSFNKYAKELEAADLINEKKNKGRIRYIELFPSTYEEAKKRILNDARSNAKQFVGDDEDDDTKIDTNDTNIIINNIKKDNTDTNNIVQRASRSRSRSRQRSRSTSRDYRQREIKRRHSPSVSPPPRSRPPPRNMHPRSFNNNNSYRRRSRSRSPVRRTSPRSGEHLVKIRGMPYTVVEEDVRKFFPSSCQPIRIEIVQDRRMKRPNGDGHLYFSSLEDVDEAMKCDRKYMGSRYVELYFDSPRYAALNNRRKKPDSIHRRSSRSSSRSRYNRRSRSRSGSGY